MKRRTNRREFMRTAGLSATAAGVMGVHPVAGAIPEPQAEAPRSMGGQLRQLLQGPEPIQTFGLYDVLSARLAEINGFECLFFGGSLTAELHCVPNRGLLSMAELADVYRRVADNVNIPMIADVDDLGGDPLSVYRNTQLMERAGLAGVYFEDLPQGNRHRYQNNLMSMEAMVDNIRAALDARDDLVICVNCYAQQPIDSDESWEQAMERGVAYAEAGAEVLCFASLRGVEEMRRAADRVNKPLLTGAMGIDEVGGPVSRMREAGVKIGVYERPLNHALAAVQRGIDEIKSTGLLTESNRAAAEIISPEVHAQLGRSAEFERVAREYVGIG